MKDKNWKCYDNRKPSGRSVNWKNNTKILKDNLKKLDVPKDMLVSLIDTLILHPAMNTIIIELPIHLLTIIVIMFLQLKLQLTMIHMLIDTSKLSHRHHHHLHTMRVDTGVAILMVPLLLLLLLLLRITIVDITELIQSCGKSKL